ncbi:MAG TPA: methyltransferase domain-containing protein [Jiangellaceae bacterium]
MEPERYVIDASVQRGYVASRNARTFLPFLLPHLHAGMDILDAGCGVGAIALDLAKTVSPRRIVGIDIDAGQVAAARASADEHGIGSAEFAVGSVYELPFAAGSFDVVYANTVLLYLRDPVRALSEMRRVLRPGGIAAVSDDDISTIVFSPEIPGMSLGPTLFAKAVEHEGGNTTYSRHLRTLLRQAGFSRTQGYALTPETYGESESTRWMADFAIGLFSAPSMAETIASQGWASPAELDTLLSALREWGERPDAFMTWLYCAALGWVD